MSGRVRDRARAGASAALEARYMRRLGMGMRVGRLGARVAFRLAICGFGFVMRRIKEVRGDRILKSW